MKRKRNIRTKPNSVIKSVVVQSVYSMPTLSRDSLEWQITRESSATRKKMEKVWNLFEKGFWCEGWGIENGELAEKDNNRDEKQKEKKEVKTQVLKDHEDL